MSLNRSSCSISSISISGVPVTSVMHFFICAVFVVLLSPLWFIIVAPIATAIIPTINISIILFMLLVYTVCSLFCCFC